MSLQVSPATLGPFRRYFFPITHRALSFTSATAVGFPIAAVPGVEVVVHAQVMSQFMRQVSPQVRVGVAPLGDRDLAVIPVRPTRAPDERDPEGSVGVVLAPEAGHQVGTVQLALGSTLERLELIHRCREFRVVALYFGHQGQLNLRPQRRRVTIPRLRVAEGPLDPLLRLSLLAVGVSQKVVAVTASYRNLRVKFTISSTHFC